MFPLLVLILLPVMSCINSAASQSHASENGFNNATSHCIDKERRALLAFKAGFVGDLFSLSSWSSEEVNKDCCNWNGVECSNGHVIKLDLWGCGLKGNIGPSLLELRELNYLDLSSNDFEHRPIPNFFGSFTKLQHLDLSQSNLAGTIPSQLGNLSNLKQLDIEYSLLDGMIPQSFGNLRNLQYLALSNCNLAGTIPSQLGNLSNLNYLDLSSTLLNGTIPKSFGNLSNLQTLSLSNSSLAGTIPSQLGNLFNLTDLDLSSNLLDGMIPKSFGNLCNLQRLNLENNNLSGNLSFVDKFSGCAAAPALKELLLFANQLNETLTKNLGTLSNLEYLDLSSNSFTGLVSEAHLLNLTYLNYLDLSLNPLDFQINPRWVPPFQLDYINLKSCNLGPSFPQWIQTQKRFSYLDISNTGIPDRIPSWFWDNLSEKSTFLNLSSNNIGGIVPDLSSKVGRAGTYSGGIDLSSNNFEGPIPPLPPLASINLSKNKFTGGLSFLCQLSGDSLTFLDISNNLLTGGLPDCLGGQHQLVVLNLAHNTLSGEISSFVGSLSSLETLNLYNNIFSGVLPKSLSNCTQLSFLHVGMNKFTGNVPSWIGGNLSHLSFLSLRSNNFFGTIPSNLCRLPTLQVLDLSINNLFGTVVPCLNNITALTQKGVGVTDHDYAVAYIQFVGIKDVQDVRRYPDNSAVEWNGRMQEFENNLKFLKAIDLSSNNLSGEIPDEITQLFELVALNLSRNALQGKVPYLIGRLKSLMSLDLSRNMLSGEIPVSLSDLSWLGYLNVSYNNFSGKIPSGTQLQGFDASYYIGNVGLCGPPLTSKCPGKEPPPLVVDNEDSIEDNDEEYWKWLYIGMAVGFVTGFWGICGALLLYRPGRHAFFSFVDDLKDWCYVKIAVKLAR